MSLTDDIYQAMIELGGRDLTTPQIRDHLLSTKKMKPSAYDIKVTISQSLNKMQAWGIVNRICKKGDKHFHWELGLEQ